MPKRTVFTVPVLPTSICSSDDDEAFIFKYGKFKVIVKRLSDKATVFRVRTQIFVNSSLEARVWIPEICALIRRSQKPKVRQQRCALSIRKLRTPSL